MDGLRGVVVIIVVVVVVVFVVSAAMSDRKNTEAVLTSCVVAAGESRINKAKRTYAPAELRT